MDKLINNVESWAIDKGLLPNGNSEKQLIKTVEELGELSKAILKNNKAEQIDGIGDVTVCLIILSKQLGFDFESCLQAAYDEIKGRKGKLIDGTFIKEADLK